MNKKKTNLERILAHQKKSWMRSGATIDDERQFIQEEIIRRPKEAYFMAFLCGFLSGPGFAVYFP